MKNLTPARLREMLSYDPETGIFVWAGHGRGIPTGKRAGSVDPNGYRYIKIDRCDYLAQRLAWFWVNGTWPRLIRFQNKDRDDCRIANLEEGFHLTTKHDHRTKEGRSAYGKEWRIANPDLARERDLKSNFGITLAEYSAKLLAQNGVCAICQKVETETRQGKLRALAVDHCHTTGAVRDLLCMACNKMIGLANEDRSVLLNAIRYLDRHAGATPNIVPLKPTEAAG